MPKLKTKSGAKKRFSLTASGKVKFAHAKKKHNMRKLPPRSVRELRGTGILCEADAKIIKKYLPYG